MPRPIGCCARPTEAGVKSGAKLGQTAIKKWARANTWVTDDLGLKIQTKTDALIKTVQSSQDTRMLVVTITKNTTLQSGVYEMDFVAGCSSILSCIPSVAESRARFASFLLAPEYLGAHVNISGLRESWWAMKAVYRK
jgi:hypothetical protein